MIAKNGNPPLKSSINYMKPATEFGEWTTVGLYGPALAKKKIKHILIAECDDSWLLWSILSLPFSFVAAGTRFKWVPAATNEKKNWQNTPVIFWQNQWLTVATITTYAGQWSSEPIFITTTAHSKRCIYTQQSEWIAVTAVGHNEANWRAVYYICAAPVVYLTRDCEWPLCPGPVRQSVSQCAADKCMRWERYDEHAPVWPRRCPRHTALACWLAPSSCHLRRIAAGIKPTIRRSCPFAAAAAAIVTRTQRMLLCRRRVMIAPRWRRRRWWWWRLMTMTAWLGNLRLLIASIQLH